MAHQLVASKLDLPSVKSNIGLKRPDNSKGIVDWLTTVDHKKIGIMYGFFAVVFLLVGGIEALLIRIQLAVPENHFISAQLYNQLFTMHGTVMIFLGAMPLVSAFFNFLVPLQIGARDVAFPRLNSFSLWTFLAGAIVLNFSWILQFAHHLGYFNPAGGRSEIAPAVGWFGYAPLSEKAYTGIGTDFWIVGLLILGVATLAAAFNFIVTIINMRAPGMTMMRLPAFTWMTLIVSFLILFAFPPLTIGLVELLFARFFGTHFFRVEMGGQPILWQHLFWIFGHPEVYILILPAMGAVSEILPTFSKKPLFGYPIVVFSGSTIGFLGFAVWSHHMFTTGLGTVATTAFSLMTMAIAIPTGVKIFNWIGTLWGGRIRFSVPMLCGLGFIWMFMLGGFSGIMHSSASLNAQQQDTYFVVAHFHYVILGGIVIALVGGIYYWLPKVFGRMMNEKVGYLVAFLVIVGFNITFGPMHYLGLIGMPRRTHTYLSGFGWEYWNMVSTIGSFILGFGILIFFLSVIYTVIWGEQCGTDPWNARTLEWSVASPPPAHNFDRTPIVSCRDAFWMHKHGNSKIEYEKADFEIGIHMPSQSWWPLLCGLGFTVMGIAASLFAAEVPYSGFITIGGIGILFLGIYLWALEGPGGYHLKPSVSEQSN